MDQLITVSTPEDIFPEYRNTPIGPLLEYHNLSRPFETFTHAQLLIGMCMDNSKYLYILYNFAYIIVPAVHICATASLKFLSPFPSVA